MITLCELYQNFVGLVENQNMYDITNEKEPLDGFLEGAYMQVSIPKMPSDIDFSKKPSKELRIAFIEAKNTIAEKSRQAKNNGLKDFYYNMVSYAEDIISTYDLGPIDA